MGANWKIMKDCREDNCYMKMHTIFTTRYSRVLLKIEELREKSIEQAKEIAKKYEKTS